MRLRDVLDFFRDTGIKSKADVEAKGLPLGDPRKPAPVVLGSLLLGHLQDAGGVPREAERRRGRLRRRPRRGREPGGRRGPGARLGKGVEEGQSREEVIEEALDILRGTQAA